MANMVLVHEIIFLTFIGIIKGYGLPPTDIYQLPTLACEEDVACFGTRNGEISYGVDGENEQNSCIKANDCVIRIRTSRYSNVSSKVWWELQVPAAWSSPGRPDVVTAMFWISKTRSNLNKPNGRVAIQIKVFTSSDKPRASISNFNKVLVSPNGKLVTNDKTEGFRFLEMKENRYWDDDRLVQTSNYVNIFTFESNTTLRYEDLNGFKCYDIDLLKDEVFLHLSVNAPVIYASEQVVSDTPMMLYEYKTGENNPHQNKRTTKIVDDIACNVESANDVHNEKLPITTLRTTTTKLLTKITTETVLQPSTPVTEEPPIIVTDPNMDETSVPSKLTTSTSKKLPTIPTDKSAKQSSSPIVFYILGGVLLIALILIALLCIFCKKKRQKPKRPIVNRGSDESARFGSDPELRSNLRSVRTGYPSNVDKRSKISSNVSNLPRRRSIESLKNPKTRSRMNSMY